MGQGIIGQAGERSSYGVLSGIIGVAVNAVLVGLKLLAGASTNSIAVWADAFNNLADVGSSVVTLIGFRLAARPPDREHPFGHGRAEYLTSLVVSAAVMFMAFELLRTSLERIAKPETVEFNWPSFLVLLTAILVKLWLGSFNRKMAGRIDSNALRATALDSYADALSTATAALSLVLSQFTRVPLDGFAGIVLSAYLGYSAYSLIKESVDLLMGSVPPRELVELITQRVLSHKGVVGIHDLMVHNYGPGRCVISLHAEVPETVPVRDAHEVLDTLERELSEELQAFVTVHMDPINTDDEEVNSTRQQVEQIVLEFPEISSLHDFRVVGSGSRKNVIFDVVVRSGLKPEEEAKLKQRLANRIRQVYPGYNAVITVDREFV